MRPTSPLPVGMKQDTNHDGVSEPETEPLAADAATGTEDGELDKDDLFHLLKSSRRRRALRFLLAAESEPVEMRTVAEAVAAEEYGKPVEALHSDERQRVYITLYQLHLPQLDDAGVIDYNQSRGRITTNPVIEAFDEYLEEDDTPNRSRNRFEAPVEPVIAGFGGGGIMTLLLLQMTGTTVFLALSLIIATVVTAWLVVGLQ